MKEKSNIQRRKPASSHDSLFKHFYSDPKLVQELLQLIFSKKELKAYNLKKVKIEKDTFEEKRADLIVSVPFRANSKRKLELLILLEHKSFYDKNSFSQILKYQVLIREHIIKQKGYSRPIIPVLFYHGKEPLKWEKSLQEEDFKSFFSEIPAESRRDMLNYGLRIINTQDPKVQKFYKDQKFKGRGVIKLLSEIWDIKKITLPIVKEVFVGFKDILKPLKGERERDTSLRILEYLSDNTDLSLKIWKEAEVWLMEEGILTRGGVMDIREHIREKGRWEGRKEGLKEGRLEGIQKGMQKGIQKGMQKGRLEGIQKGRLEVVLNLLKEKADIALISKVTGLSTKEIKKLKNGF